MKKFILFLITVLLFFGQFGCDPEPSPNPEEPCNMVKYYERLTARLNDLQLLEAKNIQGEIIQIPKYAVIRLIDYTPYYSQKMWHSALWCIAVDMANRSGLKEEARNDPNYQNILDVFSQILLASSEYSIIRQNIPFVQEKLGHIQSVMYQGSGKFTTYRNSLQKASNYVSAVSALLYSLQGVNQLEKSPFIYDYTIELFYYLNFVIPEASKSTLYSSNSIFKSTIDNCSQSLTVSYENFTTTNAEQLIYFIGAGIVGGAIMGTGVLPGPGTVGGAIIGAAVFAAMGITAEVLSGGTQFVLNHDIATRQLTLALSFESASTVNEKYFRSICLYLGLSTIKDKVLGNGLIQIVAGALGYIIDNEEKRWYDFMNNDFQPSRDKDNQCFTDGMSMLSISEPNSNYYINEDFESYQVNTFPSSGGWILKYNGAGNDKQRIVTDFHVSGSKSMRMEGKLNPPYWWAACMYHSLNMSNSTFYIEGMILGSASGTGVLEDGGGLEFSNRDEGTWGTGYAGVGLDAKTGTIGCSIGSASQVIQSYTANEWYKIKMRFDVPNSSLDVWIDDVQKISGLHGTLSQLGFTSISLSACHGHTIFYYDDIKVWKE